LADEGPAFRFFSLVFLFGFSSVFLRASVPPWPFFALDLNVAPACPEARRGSSARHSDDPTRIVILSEHRESKDLSSISPAPSYFVIPSKAAFWPTRDLLFVFSL
jgi:hypothetical protein